MRSSYSQFQRIVDGAHHPGRRCSASAPTAQRYGKNTLSVTGVRVRLAPAPFERGVFPGFTNIQQALVTFDATHTNVYGANDGPRVGFVYVIRQGARAPAVPGASSALELAP